MLSGKDVTLENDLGYVARMLTRGQTHSEGRESETRSAIQVRRERLVRVSAIIC